MPNFSSPFVLTSGQSGLRDWTVTPGADGSFWVQPFYTTAIFDTTSSTVNILRNGVGGSSPRGVVNLRQGFGGHMEWIVGHATDPLINVTNTSTGHSINVRIPLGKTVWGPGPQGPMGGADATQPYLVWATGGDTTIHNADQNNGVTANSFITCSFNMSVDDGSGLLMCDAETGQQGNNNVLGAIQDWELTAAKLDPHYVIPHTCVYLLDPAQVNSNPNVFWPLSVFDQSLPFFGNITQGATIGIPKETLRPLGKTRGFYLLFDNLQQFGWFYYNVASTGSLSFACYSLNATNDDLAADVAGSISDVLQYVGILTNQSGLSTIKGKAPGGVNAYPAPPLLDLSPTGGVRPLPHTFGAWYPSTKAPFNNATGTGNDVLG